MERQDGVERLRAEVNGDPQLSPELSLVVPCYNEEACLRQTATEILSAFDAEKIRLQLILVDNGSRDSTGKIVDELIGRGLPVSKATVPLNMGYGNGILEGLKHATAPFVGYACADGQVEAGSAVQAYKLARAATGPVLAKVRRRFRQDSWRRKFVSIIYNLGMQCIFGWLGSIDLNASPKILRRESLLAMNLRSQDWFLDPELMIKSKHLGLKLLEFEIRGQLRQGGKSNVRFSTCFEFVKNILKYRASALREWKRSIQNTTSPEAARASHTSPAAPVSR